MNELDERLQTLERQEQSLVFEKFSQEDAVAIGLKMFEKAKAEGCNIAIHISLNRRDVFHLSMDGCTPDNDVWLRKKENMVYRFLQSSYRTVSFCERMRADLFEFYAWTRENMREQEEASRLRSAGPDVWVLSAAAA